MGEINNNYRLNFYDAQSAIRFYNDRSAQTARPTYVTTVLVRFAAFKSIELRDALIDFIKELFCGIDLLFGGTESETQMFFFDRSADVPGRIDMMLEKCVMLNTYFKHYFYPLGDVDGFCIYCGVHHDGDKLTSLCFCNYFDASDSNLVVNEQVRTGSAKAAELLRRARIIGADKAGESIYDYDFTMPELASALDKMRR